MKIAQVLVSNVWGEVGPAALERGIGGREGAMIYLSREWAKMGHEVTNFVDVKEGQRFKEPFIMDTNFGARVKLHGFHEYVPLNLCKPMLANFPWDVAIAWECPSVFEDHRILNSVNLKICEMQVCHFSGNEQIAAGDFCDYTAVLSKWHGEFLKNGGLNMDDDEIVVLPNGIDLSRYPKDKIKPFDSKRPVKFVYSSSPDRGLWYLLQIWPKILKDFPDAELLITYGAQNWIDFNKWSHGRAGEMAVEIEMLMKQKGVKDIGKVGQSELAKLQLEAIAWPYPLDAMNATESGCITAIENAAAGNPIITTNCDCMPSEFGSVGRIVELPWNPDSFYKALYSVLTDEEYYNNLQYRGRQLAEKRDWSFIAKQWNKLFEETLWKQKLFGPQDFLMEKDVASITADAV